MPLQRAPHANPDRIRQRLLATSLKALAQLRVEREEIEGRDGILPKDWCERFKLIADQIRRDLPDQPAAETAAAPAKPALTSLKLVSARA